MNSFKRHLTTIASGLGLGLIACSGLASAAASHDAMTKAASGADQQRISAIIAKGDQEISRRLTTLGTLTSKINGASKLSSSDKTALTSEVSAEVSGLTALKTKLDADTTLADLKTDVQSIFSDYRVYALIVPKVQLVKTADDQQVVETKLTDLATKLQTRLDAAKAKGKDVTSLQAKLDDMKTQTSTAQAISIAIQAKVIGLQPSDYNSDHSLLSGHATQLKTAHTANQAATADAKAIVAGVKNL